MSDYADLHIHTHFSDSTSSPDEVIEQAHAAGLDCISITDHDTIDGIKPTMISATKYNIEVITGVELSSEIQGKDVHVLGYCFDLQDESFVERLTYMQNFRMVRMEKMIKKLQELGINNITMEEVCALAESKSVGRPHLAQLLVEKGWVSSFKRAFNEFLADDAPAHVGKFKQSPFEAIEMIKAAGGKAVLAHPMLTDVDEIIPQMVDAGLAGLEVHYPHTPKEIFNHYVGLAKKHNLLITGGSDAHGDAKKHTYVGKMKIPYALVEALKNA